MRHSSDGSKLCLEGRHSEVHLPTEHTPQAGGTMVVLCLSIFKELISSQDDCCQILFFFPIIPDKAVGKHGDSQ